MLGQVRQRRKRLRQRSQKLADVITCRYTVLGKHGVDDLARIEHVRREVWKGGVEGVLIGFTKACQQNGGEEAAGKAEVVVPRCRHAACSGC